MAVPRSNGEHAMIDCAVSQFSYGKIEDCRLRGVQLPVPGGYDTKGELTTDPTEIEKHGESFQWDTGKEADCLSCLI